MIITDIEKKEITERLRKFGERREDILAVYIFGSFLTSSAPEDIDIAVLLRRVAGADAFVHQRQILHDVYESTQLEPVDIVLLRTADPIIQMQVLRYGKLLYVRNQKLLDEFVIKICGSYYDLKKIREPIEREILNGRIYA